MRVYQKTVISKGSAEQWRDEKLNETSWDGQIRLNFLIKMPMFSMQNPKLSEVEGQVYASAKYRKVSNAMTYPYRFAVPCLV